MKRYEDELDEMLFNCFNVEDIPVPEDFDEFVKSKIEEGIRLSEEKKKVRWRVLSKKMVAILALAIVVVSIGIVGKAASDAYNARMEAMSEKEKENIVKRIDNSRLEAASMSRDWTKGERERLERLRKEYADRGNFPTKTIKEISSIEEIDKDTICVLKGDDIFFLPERELTDEELLEFIDYYEKANYALKERAKEWEKGIQLTQLSESELTTRALSNLKDCMGINTENVETSTRYYNVVADADGNYTREVDVIVTDSDHNRYVVDMNAQNGVIREIRKNIDEITLKSLNKGKDYSLSEIECREVFEQLKEVANRFKSGNTITGGSIHIEIDNDKIEEGYVVFCYAMSNDERVFVGYDMNEKTIDWLRTGTKEFFESIQKTWKKECESENHKYKIIEINGGR